MPAFDGDNAVTIALKQVRQDPEPLPGDLPAGVRGLIGRALLKDPAARLPDGAAFVAAIDDVLAGRPLAEVPATVAVPPAATGEMPRPRAAAPASVPSGAADRARCARRPRAPAEPGRRRSCCRCSPCSPGPASPAALLQALADPQPASTGLGRRAARPTAASSWTPTTTSGARSTRSRSG